MKSGAPVQAVLIENHPVRVAGRGVVDAGWADAEEEHGAGLLVEHEGEVLGAHDRRRELVDAALAEQLARDLAGEGLEASVVGRDRVADPEVDLGAEAVRLGDALDDAVEYVS